jgi:hypothetical protein
VERGRKALSLAEAIRAHDFEESGAASRLAAALAPLAAPAAISPNDGPLEALYNRAVTCAKRLHSSGKAEYRFQEVSGGALYFNVPEHTGWVRGTPEGDQLTAVWLRDRGVTDRTTLRVWMYSMSTDYVDPDGKVIGGDNVGARLKRFFDDDRKSLTKVTKASAATIKLSRAIGSVRGYEVRGEDNVGLQFWYREWYIQPNWFKGFVLNVSLRRSGVLLDQDPEIEFLLDSMRPSP